jgi:Tfp pilus assembly protein PilN
VKRPVNLAARPFRNERLPALLFGLGVVALVAITVEHAFLVRRLLPDRTSVLHAEAAALETEVAALRVDSVGLRGPGPDKASVERWTTLKELVDRRTFAWTDLLARLEAVLPRGVRLISIQPGWDRGDLNLNLEALARNSEDGFALVKALEDRPEFEDVYPLSKDEPQGGGDVRFRYSMRYAPQLTPPAGAADSAAGGAAATASDDEDVP